MKKETIREKRANTCDEIDIAKDEVNYKRLQLKENLEHVNHILKTMKKTRKIISCLIYLRLNWLNDKTMASQLENAERRLKDFSNLYKIAILERKLLKNEFKQAQRKLAKKLKRIKDFDKKYFPKGGSNGQR